MLLFSALSFLLPSAFAAVTNLQARDNTCSLPKYQPLIEKLARQFPKPKVNAFCSAVVGKNGLPRTTVQSYTVVTEKRTIVDSYTVTVRFALFRFCLLSLLT